MTAITREDLELHRKWQNKETSGVRLERRGVDGNTAFSAQVNLSGIDLSGIDLSGAELKSVNLSNADLSNTNLSNTDLSHSNLARANLSGANISRANLFCANLSWARLIGADIQKSNLSMAILARAYLWDANLSGALLFRANFSRAHLNEKTNFKGVHKLAIAADSCERLRAVASAALQPGALDMQEIFPGNNTAHSIAWWAIEQAGEPGRILQWHMGLEVAALLLLGAEAHSHFYDSNEDALEYLREVLESDQTEQQQGGQQ